MLTTLVFLPLAVGVALLMMPRGSASTLRAIAVLGAALVFGVAVLETERFAAAGLTPLRLEHAWIPTLGATYALYLDGLSLSLVVLTTLLSLLVFIYSRDAGETTKEFLFLFFLMETGLLGVFLARDLLLFYVFWEVALVPLYFIIGIWGHERRREAALKFFLYTRAGSLALLLAILVLYFHTEPRSFGLEAIAAAGHTLGASRLSSVVLLGFVLGFGVKLPIVPLHSWLPDAHVEAPTGGSVMLAGALLKIGGYGFLRVAMPTVPAAVQQWGWLLLLVGVIDVVYAVAVALAQTDFKRLVAYTSINHMGFVVLGATLAVTADSETGRTLAYDGAAIQMISHGILTGAMFFLVGMLQERTGTRELNRLGGAWRRMPVYAAFLTIFAFGSFGVPTLSGFVAEFQVFAALVREHPWTALWVAGGVVLSTALYLIVLQRVAFGEGHEASEANDLGGREVTVLAALLVATVAIGLFPGPFLDALAPIAHLVSVLGR